MKKIGVGKNILAYFSLLSLLLMFSPEIFAERFYADMVIVNANIITVNNKNPRAEALAVKDGKFIALGETSEIKELIGEHTNVIDAQWKTVIPGFIDAHMHPQPIYPDTSRLGIVDLSPQKVKTIDDVIHVLKEKVKITPEGQWVRGSGYQDTKLGRHPTRWDLDKASTEHPIFIGHSSSHVAAVNSKAFELAKITKDTVAPPGGAFDKDRNGELTGVCREGAKNMVLNSGHPLPVPTRQEELDGIRFCFNKFVSKGITSVADASTTPSKIKLYQDALEEGQPVRIYLMILERYLTDLKKLYLRTGFGSDRLKIGPIKIFHGNSLSGRTCWLYEPYDIVNPETGKQDYYGIPPGRSQEELDELVFTCHKAGFQCAIHSNGDREIDMVLNAFEKALKKLPRSNHRHRIEHCSVVNQNILQRVKKLGLVLALHSYVYEHGDKMDTYGQKRWGMMHPNRSVLEYGIPVAGNSDYSVSAADPLLRIQSMVTRKTAEGKVYGPEQKISVEDAIRIWTLGSAYASFEENTKGSIEIRKLADLVILSQDPTKVDPNTIKDIEVEKTIIGGKIVYKKRK